MTAYFFKNLSANKAPMCLGSCPVGQEVHAQMAMHSDLRNSQTRQGPQAVEAHQDHPRIRCFEL